MIMIISVSAYGNLLNDCVRLWCGRNLSSLLTTGLEISEDSEVTQPDPALEDLGASSS